MNRASGTKLKIEISEDGGRPVGINHSKLPREIGILVRNHVSLKYKTWSKVPGDDKSHLYMGIEDKFDVKDWGGSYVTNYIEMAACKLYGDFISRTCHSHYKSLGGGDVARSLPPEELIHRKEEWLCLCDHFDSESYKKRSLANKNNRAKLPYVQRNGSKSFEATLHDLDCDPIELFKNVYIGPKGWSNKEAKFRYNTMVDMKETLEGEAPKSAEEICADVLGTRSTYIPGRGFGPKPSNRLSKRNGVQDKFMRTNAIVENQKTQLEEQKNQIEAQQQQINEQCSKLETQEKEMQLIKCVLSRYFSEDAFNERNGNQAS